MRIPSVLSVLRLWRAIACAALLAAAPVAAAAGAQSVFLEDLTWTELRAQIRAGTTTIIVPIGGTEQNGPYIALGKHNVRVRMLAERIARGLGHALVAPVIAYVPEGSIDPPAAHMRFPGTISISERSFEALLESAARSFRAHGFRDIVFLGDHGGYQKSLQAVADRLDRAWAASGVRAHAIVEFYRLADAGFRDTLRQRGFADAEIGTHAGLADTSLTLALDPALVRPGVASAAPAPADGVYGDPRRSSAELGRIGVDAIVTGTIDAIRRSIAHR